MNNGNGHHTRLWQVAIAVLLALFGTVGWLFQREVDALNARIDRVVGYVLEHGDPPEKKPLTSARP